MKKETIVKMKLSDLNMDEKLMRLRPINMVFVSRYRQAYRTGADMPLVIVDRKTRKIVSGNHRVTAMRQEYGLDYEVEVILRDFQNEKAILIQMAKENAPVGNALSGISRRMIAIELMKVGCTVEEVSQLFNVPVNSIVKWGDRIAYIIGKREPKRRVDPTPEQIAEEKERVAWEEQCAPIKLGPDIQGEMITEKQYEEHMAADKGLKAYKLAEQLTRWFHNDWIKRDDERTMNALTELYNELGTFLNASTKRRARS